MGLFSNLFKAKTGSESKKTIESLKKWEQEHFPNNGFRYNVTTVKKYTGTSRYNSYHKESGETISLVQIPLPQEEKSKSKSIFSILKNIIVPEKKPTLPSLIIKYRNAFGQEIQKLRENLVKLDKLSSSLRADSFFTEIDHVFNSKLKILYNELLFCKFENLRSYEYFNKICRKLTLLCRDMSVLNSAFADYMYALTKTEYENNKQDLESIKIRVEAMSEVVEKYEV